MEERTLVAGSWARNRKRHGARAAGMAMARRLEAHEELGAATKRRVGLSGTQLLPRVGA